MINKFECKTCGNCCKVAAFTGLVPVNKYGTACKFLDLETNLCTIYNDRPDFCNVDYMINFVYVNNGKTYEQGIKDTKIKCIEMRDKLCGN